jgi:hypothetical protein
MDLVEVATTSLKFSKSPAKTCEEEHDAETSGVLPLNKCAVFNDEEIKTSIKLTID